MKNKCVLGGESCRSKWDNFGMNIFLGVMGAGVLLAAWMLMQQAARNQVVHEFSEAARAGDLQALNSRTDWTSVRDWMKKDLRARATDPRLAMPPESVDAMVDDYVRPENLMDLVYYFNNHAGSANPLAFVSDPRFSGITEFTIEIMLPPSADTPWANTSEPIRAGFALDGLGWKLKRLEAPSAMFSTASMKQKHRVIASQ